MKPSGVNASSAAGVFATDLELRHALVARYWPGVNRAQIHPPVRISLVNRSDLLSRDIDVLAMRRNSGFCARVSQKSSGAGNALARNGSIRTEGVIEGYIRTKRARDIPPYSRTG